MAKRETLYPVKIGLNLPPELGAAVHREATRADESATRTARESVRIGLPILRERRRKNRRNARPAPAVAPGSLPTLADPLGDPGEAPEAEAR